MDREQILEHLTEAERQVAEGERRLVRQRERIEQMASNGQEVRIARELLAQSEHTHTLQIADRDRLRDLLAACRTPDPPES